MNRKHFLTAADWGSCFLAGFRAGPFGVPGACLQVPAAWPLQVVHSMVVVPFKPSGAHLWLLSQIPMIWRKLLLKNLPGTCLVLQWLIKTLCFQWRVGWVQCVVRELRSYMPHSQKKKNTNWKKKELDWLGQSHLDNLPFTILLLLLLLSRFSRVRPCATP